MKDMNCTECCLKHIAAAISYAKEIIAAHSIGNELDHRPDFLGEVENLIHHLQLVDKPLADEVYSFRKRLQEKRVIPAAADIDYLRTLYLRIEQRQGPSLITTQTITTRLESPLFSKAPDIVYGVVDNLDFFRFSLHSVLKHFKNRATIYVLDSKLDLTEFDVNIVKSGLVEFCKKTELTENFIFMMQNQALLQDFDATYLAEACSSQPLIIDEKTTWERLNESGISGTVADYDFSRPQPVNKVKFSELMAGVETQYPISVYQALQKKRTRTTADSSTCFLSKSLCCSARQNILYAVFVVWRNEACFVSMMNFLNKNANGTKNNPQ